MPPCDWFPASMDFRNAVSIHLSGNFYPPLPQDYVPLAVEARDACLEADWNRPITIPANINPVPRQAQQMEDGSWQVSAAQLLDVLRLHVPDEEDLD